MRSVYNAATLLRDGLLRRARILGRGTTELGTLVSADAAVSFDVNFGDQRAVVRVWEQENRFLVAISATFAAEDPAIEADFNLGAADWMASKVGGEPRSIRDLADWLADLKVLERGVP